MTQQSRSSALALGNESVCPLGDVRKNVLSSCIYDDPQLGKTMSIPRGV